jgi:hypothetical protein
MIISHITGLGLIRAERAAHTFNSVHDDGLPNCALRQAAMHYATPAEQRLLHPETAVPVEWPLPSDRWKPKANDRVAELVKAGSLLLADADRAEREGKYDSAGVLRERAVNLGWQIDQILNPPRPEPTVAAGSAAPETATPEKLTAES